MLVRESINFERGGDPRKTLGLGPDPDNKNSFVPFVVGKIPEILGMNSIPEDILGKISGPWIKRTYSGKINDWLIANFRRAFFGRSERDYIRAEREGLEPIGWDIWQALYVELVRIGFDYTDR